MSSDELLDMFFHSRTSGWIDMDYQRRYAEQLVMKYKDEQLRTALEIYKGKAYSLAFFTPKIMGKAIRKKQDQVKINYEVGGDIAERNRQKLQANFSQPRFRESYFDDLFS